MGILIEIAAVTIVVACVMFVFDGDTTKDVGDVVTTVGAAFLIALMVVGLFSLRNC